MTAHEQKVFDLFFKGKEARADHPLTCLNPHVWFEVKQVSIGDGRISICGDETCWFGISMIAEVRDTEAHM